MADLDALLRDLAEESQAIDDVVATFSSQEWHRPTPAQGWTVAHQVGHLLWTDRKVLLSARNPEDFPAELETAAAAGDRYVDEGAECAAQRSPDELLAAWRRGRVEVTAALSGLPDGTKLAWYGPSMSVASMTSARIMETWAHGQDILDTFGVTRVPSARLWHIARFGIRTRDFAFRLRSLTPPNEPFRVELTGPGEQEWAWGPDNAQQRVHGDAMDFCLLVTQRRHRSDVALSATGADAEQWLGIAQAFAGPPGNGRKEGQFR